MGRLTTHVLDIASGRPASNVRIELWTADEPDRRRLLRTTATNADGRTDAPLLAGDAVAVGRYELVFYVGAYFTGSGAMVAEPPYLDQVPIRIGIADANSHYHVALLVAPWSYTTYRGS
jgi:5-hydroxyisourate hydrolase